MLLLLPKVAALVLEQCTTAGQGSPARPAVEKTRVELPQQRGKSDKTFCLSKIH
jgi:hypothetical protein